MTGNVVEMPLAAARAVYDRQVREAEWHRRADTVAALRRERVQVEASLAVIRADGPALTTAQGEARAAQLVELADRLDAIDRSIKHWSGRKP
jgi:hypothetical protein